MHENQRKIPFSARIQAKVDEVVRLLREASKHPSEHWDDVCARVTEATGVRVSIVERLDEWTSKAYVPHGNRSIGTALAQGYVEVTDWADWKWEQKWRLVFKLRAWTCTQKPDDSCSQTIVSHPPQEGRETDDLGQIEPTAVHASTASAADGGPTAGHVTESSGSSDRNGPQGTRRGPEYNEAALIREFDRREKEHGANKAGFIVNDLLPRMGFDNADAKRVLRAMEAQNLVHTERRPNPNNPDRPTSFVTLNRAHPAVKKALGNEETGPFFEPVPIRGEPASATLIRERR